MCAALTRTPPKVRITKVDMNENSGASMGHRRISASAAIWAGTNEGQCKEPKSDAMPSSRGIRIASWRHMAAMVLDGG